MPSFTSCLLSQQVFMRSGLHMYAHVQEELLTHFRFFLLNIP